MEKYKGCGVQMPSFVLRPGAHLTVCRMFGGLSAESRSTLSNHGTSTRALFAAISNTHQRSPPAVTMNNHHFGVTPESFTSDYRLSSMFDVLSTNVDRSNPSMSPIIIAILACANPARVVILLVVSSAFWSVLNASRAGKAFVSSIENRGLMESLFQ